MNADLPTVFGIGVLTLATPCVLPLVPIYLGMLLGSSLEAVKVPGGRARLLGATAAFAAGFGLVFTLLGLGASSIGQFLGAHRTALTVVGGLVIVLFGLKFLHVLRIPWLDRELRLPDLRTGRRLLDAALFGVVFALGWTPCVGPILGSVLTYTASRAADPWTGALYLATYSLGVATPLLVLAPFADRLVPRLARLNARLPLFERVTGAILVVVGLGLAATTLGLFDGHDHGDRPVAHDGAALVPVEPALGAPSERPRIVEFYERDCPACAAARSRVEGLRSDCAGRRLDILAVDSTDGANRELAREYRVRVVPTFVLLDSSGAEQGRLVGAPELDDLRQAAASLLAEVCAGQDGLDLEGGARSLGRGCPGDRPAPSEPSDDPAVDGWEEPRCEG